MLSNQVDTIKKNLYALGIGNLLPMHKFHF